MNVPVNQLSCTSVSSEKSRCYTKEHARLRTSPHDVKPPSRKQFSCCKGQRGKHRHMPAPLIHSKALVSHLQWLDSLPRQRPGATSHLHWTPSFNVQLLLQQVSLFRYMMPGSHSSPSSTLEFPHTLLLRSWKHSWALLSMVL